MTKRWLIGGGAFAVAVAAFLVWLSSSGDALDVGDKVASVGSALLACVSLMVGLAALPAAPRDAAVTDVERAADDLARLVGLQWRREVAVRELTVPLDVRWSSTERPVAPTAAAVLGPGVMRARPARLKLRGGVSDLADSFARLPARQLVVIGEPEAGKTSAAILLTLGLLERRERGGAVPVLVSLSTWAPARQNLDAWVVGRIADEHPAFGRRGEYGVDVARRLVARGLVVPVLDGLDEVAPAVREKALLELGVAFGDTRPVVLTCRAAEYEQLIGIRGTPFGRAAVVELAEVAARSAADYLAAGHRERDDRWAEVVAHLRAEPDGVLASVLSSPLMIYLAKTAFAAQHTDPGELLRLGTADEVTRSLLRQYLPALYPDGTAEEFARWFRTLARLDGALLSWWRLHLALPWWPVLTAASRGGLAGVIFGLASSTFLTFWTFPNGGPNAPPALPPVFREAVMTGWFGFLGAAIGAGLGVVASVIAAFRREALVPSPKHIPPRLSLLPLWSSAGALLGAVAVTLIQLADRPDLPVPPEIVVIGAGLGAVVGIYRGSARPVAVDKVMSPVASFRGDRTTALVLAATTAVGTAITAAVAEGVGTGDEPGVAAGTALFGYFVVFLVPLSCAWVKFGVARFWFALFRRLPWRLLAFLEDAERRGVLRRVGASYQFRHQRLRGHFAR
ncbi:hypothetical protein ADK67_32595 [Saccharothrix sp. NRRL B-16348]|uniref:hypothetical protein n=1 Tax=Saccharothrix sp. NRRL B-16348 TaxID=1415542 RepID=UPI0006AF909B|nr:hypothetical protein [Saccharothrix sp. NRRL B-16348]KOX19813.1 hypothetical protein ADK67_32595 [Saccharothrix sp. NRRL B-16348]